MSDEDAQKARYEATIARLEAELVRMRMENQSLLASRNDLAEALNATHLNLNARARHVERAGGGLIAKIRALSSFLLKPKKRT